MIDENATHEAFEYYSTDWAPLSHKPIIAKCDECGKVRTTSKHSYRALCVSCALKGRIVTEETRIQISGSLTGIKFTEDRKANISAALTGREISELQKQNIRAGMKGKRNALGSIRTEETKALLSTIMKGKYVCEKSSMYKGGKKIARARSRAKRRKLGSNFLMPMKENEHGHHPTDMDIIGIPLKVHISLSGYSTKKHRALVLEWLKVNDIRKYEIVLSVLNKKGGDKPKWWKLETK